MLKKELNKYIKELSEEEKFKIVCSALADNTPFETIKKEFGLNESNTISFMKKVLQLKQFIKWRERARGRFQKHLKIKMLTMNIKYENAKKTVGR